MIWNVLIKITTNIQSAWSVVKSLKKPPEFILTFWFVTDANYRIIETRLSNCNFQIKGCLFVLNFCICCSKYTIWKGNVSKLIPVECENKTAIKPGL